MTVPDQPLRGQGAVSPVVADSPQRRQWLFGAGAVLAVAVGVSAVLLLRGGDSPPKPVRLPESFAGHARVHDATAQQIEERIRASLRQSSSGARMVKSTAIGSYDRTGTTNLDVVVLVLPSSIGAGQADYVTKTLLGVSDPNFGHQQVGPHGGSSRCIYAPFGGRPVPICAWRDKRTTGVVMSIGTLLGTSHVTPHQLNSVELAFRDAVD